MSIKVGDVVVRKQDCLNRNGWPGGTSQYVVTEVDRSDIKLQGIATRWYSGYFDRVTSKSFGARANDPDTSKKAARPKRVSLRERVLGVLKADHLGLYCQGMTGHEIAAALSAPLNSVTPRLAELRRADHIKDSGKRRDGQIVWEVVK